MFAGFGSPLFPKGRLRRAGMTPQWTFHTVSIPFGTGRWEQNERTSWIIDGLKIRPDPILYAKNIFDILFRFLDIHLVHPHNAHDNF